MKIYGIIHYLSTSFAQIVDIVMETKKIIVDKLKIC